MTREILEMARMLGHVGEHDSEALEMLCAGAAEELSGRLRAGVTVEDCGAAFPLAAAWLALAGLAAAGASGGIQRFTAGDVTIQESGDGAQARAGELRMQADRVMAPYLRDENFAFRGVRG